MLSVDEALNRVLEGLGLTRSECVPLEDGHGRVLAEGVAARIPAAVRRVGHGRLRGSGR